MIWSHEAEGHALDLFTKAGHTPQLDKDGKPDDGAFDIEDPERGTGHNGYRCTKCGYVLCVWCATAPRYRVDPCS